MSKVGRLQNELRQGDEHQVLVIHSPIPRVTFTLPTHDTYLFLNSTESTRHTRDLQFLLSTKNTKFSPKKSERVVSTHE